MPTINVKKELLMQRLGTTYSDEQFDDLCFKYGIELDEITSEKQMATKEKGASGKESDDIIYKIDLPANRYDLVSLEGLVLALKIFTEKMQPPEFKVKHSNLEITVDEYAEEVRPVLVGAVVRDVDFDQDLYNSFIDLQDKIHQNIGRKRAVVSVGTHDLDTINGPFTYTAIRPDELKFTPLNQDKDYTATELMNLYTDTYLEPYLHIIKDKPRYPVILDKNKTVLSMPPIINGNKSKITLNTKNILIEITATDREKATIALDTIVAMLSSANGKFQAESVVIKHQDGRKFTTPDLSYHKEVVQKSYINQGLGINISVKQMAALLTRMSLRANASADGNSIEVFIPPTRHDIIHKCDIMEDVGIAYGYDNIVKTLPKSATISSQVLLNKLSDQLRNEVARCGYTEALNFALCSKDELGALLRRKCPDNVVLIKNSKTSDFQAARTTLLSGLLKTVASNKKMPLPMKLYEVGDIVVTDPTKDVSAKNERHLAALYYGKQTSGFEIIHGLLDRIMQVIECPYIGEKGNKETLARGYYIKADKDPMYFDGRGAAIMYNGKQIGSLGVLHPEVITNFDLNHPASSLEIKFEDFEILNR